MMIIHFYYIRIPIENNNVNIISMLIIPAIHKCNDIMIHVTLCYSTVLYTALFPKEHSDTCLFLQYNETDSPRYEMHKKLVKWIQKYNFLIIQY